MTAPTGTRQKPWTPYRRGLAAGEAWAAEFKAWKVQPLGQRGPSPRRPACPYTVPRSVDGWQDGFRRSVAIHA